MLRPAVVSMSLGGGRWNMMDSIVARMIAAGITTVVAAGNDNGDACNTSPAGERTAITVGASTVANVRASYSNYGRCVDLFAPGSNVKSCYFGTTNGYSLNSGTSMATPHVTGVVALMLAAKPCLTPANVASILAATATRYALSDVPYGTINKSLNGKAAVAAAVASTSC